MIRFLAMVSKCLKGSEPSLSEALPSLPAVPGRPATWTCRSHELIGPLQQVQKCGVRCTADAWNCTDAGLKSRGGNSLVTGLAAEIEDEVRADIAASSEPIIQLQ